MVITISSPLPKIYFNLNLLEAYTLFLAASLFTQSAATDCCESGDTKPNEDDCSQYYFCCTGQFVLKSCPDGEYWSSKDKECQKDNGECNSNNQTCTDGVTKVDTTDCSKYQLCSNGKFESVSCNTGDYWNAAISKCEVDNGQCKGNQTCTNGELKVNPADCAGYFQCVDNKLVEQKCPADTYFDTTVMACVIDTEGVCIPKVCDPECCDVPNNWLGPVDNNCSAFIHCLYGNKFQQRCPNNLQFNNDTKECDYPENVQCDDGSPPPSGPTAGPSGTYCESKGQCVGKPDGTMFAELTDSCSGNYIVCQCECEINFKCPDGLVFNEKVRSCDWPANVN